MARKGSFARVPPEVVPEVNPHHSQLRQMRQQAAKDHTPPVVEDTGLVPSEPGDTGDPQEGARRRQLAADSLAGELRPDWMGERPRHTFGLVTPSTHDTGRTDTEAEDTDDTGGVDTGRGDTGLEDTGLEDTGEPGDYFGGTFGAERIEAVAVGEDWPQEVTDAVHGHREKLGEGYDLVEASPQGQTPEELIFESPDGDQYSVEYRTGHVTPLSEEQRTPYGGE